MLQVLGGCFSSSHSKIVENWSTVARTGLSIIIARWSSSVGFSTTRLSFSRTVTAAAAVLLFSGGTEKFRSAGAYISWLIADISILKNDIHTLKWAKKRRVQTLHVYGEKNGSASERRATRPSHIGFELNRQGQRDRRTMEG